MVVYPCPLFLLIARNQCFQIDFFPILKLAMMFVLDSLQFEHSMAVRREAGVQMSLEKDTCKQFFFQEIHTCIREIFLKA